MYYKNGKLDGPFKKYDENGLLMEELNFRDGRLDGVTTKYYVNGNYAMEEIYEEGRLVSSKWIDNKQLEKQKQREQGLNKLSEFKSPKNAKTEDTVEIETTDVKYISYFATLKKQIELHWTYPEESRDRNEEGQLILIFTITKKGDLDEIQLVSSSGYAHLDNEAVRAIRVASPFPKFPQDWGELEKLHVKATFIYNFGGFTRKRP